MSDDQPDENEIATLKAKKVRSSIQGLLTKQLNIFNERGPAMSYTGLTVMLAAINDYNQRFMAITEKLWELAAGDQHDEKNVELKQSEFEDTYMSLKVAIMELCEERRPHPEFHSSTVVGQGGSSGGGDPGGSPIRGNPPPPPPRAFRLPKLELPKFSGQYHEWTGFKNEFSSMIVSDPSLTDIDRFRFLRSALGEKPRQLITNMETTEANFKLAWDALKERYDSKALIVRSHINELFSLQGGSGSSTDQLRELLDKAQSHFRSLSSLGSDREILENVLICIVLSRLDQKAQARWEESTDNSLPKWDKFIEKMEHYAGTLERISVNKDNAGRSSPSKSTGVGKRKPNHHTLVSNQIKCAKCNQKGHSIDTCPSILSLTPEDRHALVKTLRLCFMCLKDGHSFDRCRARCSKCRGRHHDLLHFDPKTSGSTPNSGASPQAGSSSSTPVHQALVAAQMLPDEHVLLASVVVHVLDANGSYVPCHAVLDPGSTNNYLTENFLRLINGRKMKSDVSISGIGNTIATARGQSVIQITSRFDHSQSFTINATILQRITEPYPSSAFKVDQWNIPDTFRLADPNFNIPKPIDLLIGGGLFWKLLTCERVNLSPDLPYLFGTELGWIVVGADANHRQSNPETLCAITGNPVIEDEPSLNKLVQRFWEVDNLDVGIPRLTASDHFCEEFYSETTYRDQSGRYFVRLPFKRDSTELGDSVSVATRRFLNLERKLHRNPDLLLAYSRFVEEYESLGHLECVQDLDFSMPHYFLPHHCVFKLDSSSTKLRVVFDASCRTSTGISLNDILHSGPKLQPDLLVTLLRFRLFKYVATADIQKMYRQVCMDPRDTNFQLILWRSDPRSDLKVLRLKTVTYGTAPGAYLSVKTLYRLAQDEEASFPVGAQLLRRCFYVDDAMLGADSVAELQEGLGQLTGLLKRGCFHLSKFCSNSSDVLSQIPPENQEPFLTIDDHNIVKALGMIWEPQVDVFRFTWKPSDDPENVTKRTVLSEIARLFDPLGLISPVVTLAKILFQSLWKCPTKLEWDTPLPDEYATE